jgi:hypothetical protein
MSKDSPQPSWLERQRPKLKVKIFPIDKEQPEITPTCFQEELYMKTLPLPGEEIVLGTTGPEVQVIRRVHFVFPAAEDAVDAHLYVRVLKGYLQVEEPRQ